jgi:hypothetical protein
MSIIFITLYFFRIFILAEVMKKLIFQKGLKSNERQLKRNFIYEIVNFFFGDHEL